jgi:DNA invertase Pin-like site-specific DNA recombinase
VRPRAVGYVRVSTDRQANDGDGLEVQRDAIRAHCKAEGLRLIDVCTDVLPGTTPLELRDGLGCVLDHVDAGAEVVVVARLDRLARDLMTQEALLDGLRHKGARVATCSAGEAAFLDDDPNDPSRRMIRQVLGAVAEYERAIIALRMRMGRERKRRHGGYVDGAPRFGWRLAEGALVADEAEQAIIEQAKALRASGASLAAIAEALGHTTRRGGAWHPATVRRILDDEARAAEAPAQKLRAQRRRDQQRGKR